MDELENAVELTNCAAQEIIEFCHLIGNRRATNEQLAQFLGMSARSNSAGAIWAMMQSRTQEGRDLLSRLLKGCTAPVNPERARSEYTAINNVSGEIIDKMGEGLPDLNVPLVKEAMDKSSEFVLRQDHMERLLPMLG